MPGRRSATTTQETEIARLTRERDEALQRQAASADENAQLLNELRELLQQKIVAADVLNLISRSTFDLPKVLQKLVEFAARLCEADKGVILRPSGNDASYYVAASHHQNPRYAEYLNNLKFAPGRGSVVPRVLLEGKSVQISDVLADPEYTSRELVSVGDFRTVLGVPLLRDGVPIGVLVLHRAAVRPFTEKQIKLVETFADQAVIAIENVRLFEAEQGAHARTHRVAAAANGDLGSAARNLQLARRSRAGFCGDVRECHTHLRQQIWEYLPLGWRGVSPSCRAQQPTCHRRASQADT